jgi:hypothetical protein
MRQRGRRRARLPSCGRELLGRDLDRIDDDGKGHLTSAVEPCERADDDVGSGLAVEAQPGLPGYRDDRQPTPHELGLDVRTIDLAREAGELVVESGGVGLHGR